MEIGPLQEFTDLAQFKPQVPQHERRLTIPIWLADQVAAGDERDEPYKRATRCRGVSNAIIGLRKLNRSPSGAAAAGTSPRQ